MSITRRTILQGAGLGIGGGAAVALGPLPATATGADGAITGTAASTLAPTPPMGWNSWNSFATTITEAQALETAAIMAEKLLPAGYDIFTVDIQWYEAAANSYTYAAKPQPTLDGHGRLLPAPNRFPASAGARASAHSPTRCIASVCGSASI